VPHREQTGPSRAVFSAGGAFSDTSLNQRFALSYTANDWALTANVIWGIHMNSVTDRPQLSPCPIPVSAAFPTGLGCNPDFINVDLTAGRSFGKWQVAWVGYYSSGGTEEKQGSFAHHNPRISVHPTEQDMISTTGVKDQELTRNVSTMLIELAILPLSRFKRLTLYWRVGG
jgi:hypothetical protein